MTGRSAVHATSATRQTWLVARREIRERGRSRTFLVALVLMLISVAAAVALPALLDTGPDTKDVGLVGQVPTDLPAALHAQGEGVDTTIRVHRFDTTASGEEALRDGSVDVLLIDAQRLEWSSRTDEQLQAVVTAAIQLVGVRARAAEAGIGAGELDALIAPVPVESVELGRVAGRSPDDETATLIMSLVLFGAISTYAAMVLSGVVEEKSSRTVEVLLARMPARNLLAGKILGIGLLGLAQIAALATAALVAGALVDSVDIPAVRGGVIAWAVVWFLIGYALYATVYGTLGSLASRTEDASSVTGPVTLVLVLGFMVSFAAIGSADTTWARIVSWFPLTAPIAMPSRIAMGAATWWDPIVAVALTLATIAALVVLGGRVYTRAILHTGSTLRLADAWRGIAGSGVQTPTGTATAAPAGGTPPPPAAAATRTAGRTRVLLVVVAVALGAVVAALTRDVIIGVAAGAGAYALGQRVLKGWGPSTGAGRAPA